jgi:putative transposase
LLDVLKELDVPEAAYHRRRAQYGRMKADDAKRLKDLEADNAKLKRITTDPLLDIEGAQGVGEGTDVADLSIAGRRCKDPPTAPTPSR